MNNEAIADQEKLVTFFRSTEGMSLGQHGDDERWTPAETAIHYMKQYIALDRLHRRTTALGQGSTALADVAVERQRQIRVEGWTPAHDDEHNTGAMALAAACYAVSAAKPDERSRHEVWGHYWRWDDKWWKPKSPREDLVRAGALIIAEIERIDRAEAKAAKQTHEPHEAPGKPADRTPGQLAGPGLAARLARIEEDLATLKTMAHPPVDLRPAVRAAMDEWFRDMEALAEN